MFRHLAPCQPQPLTTHSPWQHIGCNCKLQSWVKSPKSELSFCVDTNLLLQLTKNYNSQSFLNKSNWRAVKIFYEITGCRAAHLYFLFLRVKRTFSDKVTISNSKVTLLESSPNSVTPPELWQNTWLRCILLNYPKLFRLLQCPSAFLYGCSSWWCSLTPPPPPTVAANEKA